MQALPGYQDALRLALAGVPPARARRRPLALSLGATLDEPITADRDQPPFDRATMDGYALRAADAPAPGARLRVVGEAPAGAPSPAHLLAQGQTVKISTGAPLPPGADAVVRHEWTDRAHPLVTITAPVRPGDCVHPRAADARAGSVVIPEGAVLAPHHIGVAAAVGRTVALVRAGLPTVFILTSGDEIVDPGAPAEALQPHQIRSSNGPMLRAMIPALGAIVAGASHVPDDPRAARDAVGDALERADALVTVGGVSAGDRDFLPAAFEAHGVAPLLRGAAIQPGRPIYVSHRAHDGALVIALPGNPVSVLATAHLFLWPILRALAGRDPSLPWRETALGAPVKPNPSREAFRPCSLAAGRAIVPDWSGSGDLVHTVATDGLLELPPGETAIDAGARLRFLPWAWTTPERTP